VAAKVLVYEEGRGSLPLSGYYADTLLESGERIFVQLAQDRGETVASIHTKKWRGLLPDRTVMRFDTRDLFALAATMPSMTSADRSRWLLRAITSIVCSCASVEEIEVRYDKPAALYALSLVDQNATLDQSIATVAAEWRTRESLRRFDAAQNTPEGCRRTAFAGRAAIAAGDEYVGYTNLVTAFLAGYRLATLSGTRAAELGLAGLAAKAFERFALAPDPGSPELKLSDKSAEAMASEIGRALGDSQADPYEAIAEAARTLPFDPLSETELETFLRWIERDSASLSSH